MTEVNNYVFTLSILLPLTTLFLWIGYLNFKHGWSDSFLQTFSGPAVVPTMGEEQNQAASDEEEASRLKQEEEQRMRALEKIFPASSPGLSKVFVYNSESKRYAPQEATTTVAAADGSTTIAPSCSICLEDFHEESVIMTAGCSHSYHRPCILSWVKQHTDCPNCRAGIYDQDEFEKLRDADIAAGDDSAVWKCECVCVSLTFIDFFAVFVPSVVVGWAIINISNSATSKATTRLNAQFTEPNL